MKQFAFMLSLMIAGSASGSVFTNGGFESPGGAPIRQYLPDGDTSVTGWLSNGGFEIYESSGLDGINAGEGDYYISWGHLGATGGTLQQTFDTTAGNLYTISFLLTTQQGDPSNAPQAMKAEAFDGTTLLGAYQTLSLTNDNGVWTTASFNFLATSTSTTLIFTDLTDPGNSGPLNWGLDGVSLSDLGTPATASAVPEPSTWLLAGAGLASLGFRRLRRS